MLQKILSIFYNSLQLLENKKISLLIIFFSAIVVYINTLENQFTNWDDVDLIVTNPLIRSLDFKNILKVFDVRSPGTYQPIRDLSYAIDYFLWGLNPLGYHIHSILLHALACIFLYLDLMLLLPNIKGVENISPGYIQYSVFFTAIIFAVHPVGAEAVTWLSGRKYVLFSFFSFSSLYCFMKIRLNNYSNRLMLCASLLLALLAVLSSPFGIVLPFIFFIIIFSMAQHNNPFVSVKENKAIFIPFIFITMPVLVKFWPLIFKDVINKMDVLKVGFDNFNSIFRVLFNYVRNLFFPFWLNIRYPDKVLNFSMEIKTVISIIATFFMGFLTFRNIYQNNDKKLFFCLGWFLVFLMPAFNIIFISAEMADRYIYAASPGLFLLFILYGFQFVNSFNAQKDLNLKLIHPVAFTMILFLAAGCFSLITYKRNTYWKNSGTLWKSSLEVDFKNPIAHNNLGIHLMYFDRNYDEAKKHFKEAMQMAPKSIKPIQNMFDALIMQEQYSSALEYGKKLIAIEPYNIKWHMKIAEAYAASGNVKNEEHCYKSVLKIDQSHTQALNSLASLMIAQNRYNEAESLLLKAVKSNITDADIFFNLGIVYALKNKPSQAINYFLKVVQKKKNDAVACYLIGREYMKIGKNKKGNYYKSKARQLDPENSAFR